MEVGRSVVDGYIYIADKIALKGTSGIVILRGGLRNRIVEPAFFLSKFQYLQSSRVFGVPFRCVFFVPGGLCMFGEIFGKDTAQTGTNWMLI